MESATRRQPVQRFDMLKTEIVVTPAGEYIRTAVGMRYPRNFSLPSRCDRQSTGGDLAALLHEYLSLSRILSDTVNICQSNALNNLFL